MALLRHVLLIPVFLLLGPMGLTFFRKGLKRERPVRVGSEEDQGLERRNGLDGPEGPENLTYA